MSVEVTNYYGLHLDVPYLKDIEEPIALKKEAILMASVNGEMAIQLNTDGTVELGPAWHGAPTGRALSKAFVLFKLDIGKKESPATRQVEKKK